MSTITGLTAAGNQRGEAIREKSRCVIFPHFEGLVEGRRTVIAVGAVCDADVEKIRRLIPLGLDINRADNGKFTPLMSVSWQGFTKLAELLIAYRADVNAQDENGATALMYASRFCVDSRAAERIVKLLIDNEADVNLKDAKGRTALMLSWTTPEIAERLLKAGARVNDRNADGQTALGCALSQSPILGSEEWRRNHRGFIHALKVYGAVE
jgi:hypothetical protein